MKTITAAVTMSVLLLAGCSSDSDTPAAVTTTPPAPSSPSPEPSDDGCLDVDDSMLEGISIAGETSITPVSGAAVKSPDYENVYFIAMKFSAEGVPDQVGVWASNSLEKGGGLILAVDGTAQEFTDWGDADTTDAQIAVNDPSVNAAKKCLG